MSGSSKRAKSPSIAAFMLLPQLGIGFRKYSFIVPVFIRTIAVMFEQANLLPSNHPAIRYGAEGVKRYSFADLVGEAWYNLRSTDATAQQWSIFVSVVFMVFFVALSMVMALFKASTMLVSTASAQIFDSVLGLPTDMASVAMVPEYGLGVQMFDKAVPALGGAHGDYGIMILDKILRQGIMNVGGPTQNALGALMQIYNTGVLVIAGIMLFWAVLSVVVDTAKTGQLGGGRHNMVWAPIRIVFGLGLLIPLGLSGFSSGQFMVMKLAEWGSNWGTHAWVAYVTAVVNDNLIAAYGGENPSGLINQYVRMWVCGIAYNSYISQSQGASANPRYYVLPRLSASGLVDIGTQSISYTNVTGGNVCGTITYPTVRDPALMLAGLPIVSSLTAQEIATYKRTMIMAYADLFVKMDGLGKAIAAPCPPGLFCAQIGTLGPLANDFACGFVNAHFNNPDVALGPNTMDCNYVGYCNSGIPGSGAYPDISCIVQMITKANADIAAAQGTLVPPVGALGELANFITGADFITDVEQRGWAGMGIWYHRIETMNAAVAGMQTPKVSITAGDPGKGRMMGHADKVNEILAAYDEWWFYRHNDPNSAVDAPANPLLTSDGPGDNLETSHKMSSLKDFAYGLASINPMSFAESMANFIGEKMGSFLFSVIDPADDDTYPLAKLAKVGDKMMALSTLIYFTLAVIEIVVTGFACGTVTDAAGNVASVGTFSVCGAAAEMAESAFPPIFLTTASMMHFGGILMRYYIPLLPFISVAHAVLTWMISVFEATMMVPLAALAHLTTEGEGISGHSKQIWILWLNVLMRPVLTVIGFVGSFLIFNTFVVFLHEVFSDAATIGFTGTGLGGFLSKGMYSIIYVFIIYSAATSCFKLLDLIPDALFRWLGGSPDKSFDSNTAGALNAFSNVAMSFGSGYGKAKRPRPKKKKDDASLGGSSGAISPGGLTRYNIS